MRNARLTGIVQRWFTVSGHEVHYRIACNIAGGETPAARLRNYYAMCTKVKKADEFARAALELVDWDSLVKLFDVHSEKYSENYAPSY